MAYLMGVDLGTSSLKTMMTDETGKVLALRAREYRFDAPRGGYAEQDPVVWWDACTETVRGVIADSGVSPDAIAGIGFSGQMHGAVMLDESGNSIRPAILHCDARSGDIVEEIKAALGEEDVQRLMMNPVYSGFLLVSLLWVKRYEPDCFSRIRHVCLPKDYLKYRLSGVLSSDHSDASATLAYDVEKGMWSREILDRFELPEEWFPPLYRTAEAVGHITKEAALQTGLSEKTVVVSGGGDQVMQGIGNGVIAPGAASVNIGTSGQVSFQSDRALRNPLLSTNTFAGFKENRWITMGAIMNAGLCLKWWRDVSGQSDYDKLNADVARVRPGSGGVIFLPYLNGERTPHLNPDLSGSFTGVNLSTGMAEMTRAVMEGVTFALYQCMEICAGMGLTLNGPVVSSGGGSRSDVWLQIQADVFDAPVRVAENGEQACLGACIAAGAGASVFRDIEDGCAKTVRYRETVMMPDPGRHAVYMEYYRLYKELYDAGNVPLTALTRLGRGNQS